MKLLFFTAFIFGAFPLWACPNIGGTYSLCTSLSGQIPAFKNYSISQKVINNKVNFKITYITDEFLNEVLVADGKPHEESYVIAGTDVLAKSVHVTTCSNGVLLSHGAHHVPGLGYDYFVIRKFYKKGKSLIIDWTDTSLKIPSHDVIECK